MFPAFLLSLSLLFLPGLPQEDAPPPLPKPKQISPAAEADLTKFLTPEKPTIIVFFKENSNLEKEFLRTLMNGAKDRAGFGVVALKTGGEPIARQYEIKETPTALLYDRRGRLVTRSSDPTKIRDGFLKAINVMRIDWAEEGDPRYEEAIKALGGPPQIPGILRTMSLQPQYMSYINELANRAHFRDGFLKRRTKEMIATYVSTLNKCKY
jgi:hypothetical protein